MVKREAFVDRHIKTFKKNDKAMIFLTQCASTKQKWSRFSGLCLFYLIPPEASSNGLSQNLMVAPGPQQTVQISAGMKHLPE